MKRLLSLILMMVVGAAAFAQASFSIDDLDIKPGETRTVSLKMKCTEELASFQLDIFVPDGVTFVTSGSGKPKLTDWCSDTHSLSSKVQTSGASKGALRCMVVSMDDEAIPVGDDAVLTFTVTAAADAAVGKYTVSMRNVVVTPYEVGASGQTIDRIDWVCNIYKTCTVTVTSESDAKGTVSLHGAGSDGSVASGAEVTAAATANQGYEFVSWSDGSTDNPYTFTVSDDVSLVASFDARKYDVTFVFGNGEENRTQTLEYGSVITAPADPSRTGYTFTEWSPAFVAGATVPVDGITYTAQWQINQYSITFDTDGGNAIAPITQDYGTAVTKPANPTKTGYTFTGWDKDIPSTIPAENVTIKAQWQINQYSITFDTDGGNAIAPITQDYGTAVTKPANPTKTGYTFTGWDKEIPSTIPAENVAVKALWQINQYTITFNTDGGNAIAPITQDYGTAVTKPANPTKTGYTFTGWDKDIPSTIPAENVAVKALWQINQYKVTFVADGTVLSEETLDYGTAITAPAAPEKVGYVFAGWEPEVDATVPDHAVTYTAKFMLQPYYVIYMVDGVEYKRVAFEYGSETSMLEVPVKEGHTFSGWDKTLPATMPANEIVVSGTFTINQYTITFDTDGGTEIASITQDYGTTVAKPGNPVKVGYTFTGWDKEVPATIPAEDLTIKAQWKVNQYTITFDTDGGSQIAPVVQDYNTQVTVPAEPVKEGHTFLGWDKEIPEVIPAENVTVKALWQINQYKVTFVADGAVLSEETLDYGTAITVPAAPEREGYVFAGWDPAVDNTVPARDVTYTAKYMLQPYYVIYVIDGVEYRREAFEFGSTPVLVTEPSREGYTFSGWDKALPETMPAEDIVLNGAFTVNTYNIYVNVDGVQIDLGKLTYGNPIVLPEVTEKEGYTWVWDPSNPTTVPAYDFVLKGAYVPNTYTATYVFMGEVVGEVKVQYGEEIPPFSYTPTDERYTIAAWRSDSEYVTMPAKDVTFTADVVDGIAGMVGNDADVQYYSLDGVLLQTPRKGVNIVRRVSADGQIVTSKVLVK